MKKVLTTFAVLLAIGTLSGCASQKQPKPCSSFSFGSVPCDKPVKINFF